ncbi:MAG: efflux RND transporter periplasmic adaptor subunit [Desulfobacterales bacterium]
MLKRILITIVGLIIVVGALAGVKSLQISRMVAQGEQFSPPPETVTTSKVTSDRWETTMAAVGSLEAVQGVTVTAELTGRVEKIAFEPGATVEAGALLVQQDISTESARLRAAKATVSLTKVNLRRAKELLSEEVVSQQTYDKAEADYIQAVAEADNIRSIIGKKTIRAPFAGRLGIRQVNLGQILNEGDPIVSLQAMDPIFVNFSLPQQRLPFIEPGLDVRVATDALPGRSIGGLITAVNPEVDAGTRSIKIQATVGNPDERLRPGMFVDVEVILPTAKTVLAIPATAILYAPYSDSVFVVEKVKGDGEDPSGLEVRQQFVRLGEKRGDFAEVVSGLEEGDTVVSTGVFKLRNGQQVVVDNTLSPEFKLAPKPENS